MQPTPCPTCGGELDDAGRCPFCAPGAQSAAQAAFVQLEQTGPAAAAGATEPGGARELGLLLFEAEEALARGAAEKAVVLASRAVKERPDSLTARALHERARRELLRGRRRERLEARVREAEGLLQAGDAAGAERIVTSALKLIPSHPVALALFAKLKERRQQAPTAEAWAEQELERLTQARARRSLETAQAEMAAGRERAAMMTVRRGLRHAPDDAALLSMLRDIEGAMERAKAGHHAVHAQVRAGLDLLAQGQVDESLKVLRVVLHADPDNVRAQEAIQQVRKAWLRRQAMAAAMPPVPPATPAAAASAPPAAPSRARPAARATAAPAAAGAAIPPPVPAATPSVSWDDVEAAARGRVVPHATVVAARATVGKPPAPRPVAIPAAAPGVAPGDAPTRPRALPIGVILGGAVVLLGVAVIAMTRRGPGPAAPVAASASAPNPSSARRDAGPTAGPVVGGPLAAADPDLRQAVETMLANYERALETADPALLAQARPDLTAEERAALLAPFTGAVNAATDLRVLDVKSRGDLAVIQVLRTDVIVGGPSAAHDPTEETLHLWRRRDGWMLVR
jgi:tetratricopeptide (TPR) repeat protein